MTKVVTRIAPSPTGAMHIGTARTALFNYLFAKHHGGDFLLRIEDTDKERSTLEAVQVILNGLAWLGLNNDGNTVFQSWNEDRHREIVNELLKNGHAYRDYLSAEDTAAWKAANKNKAFRSPYREITSEYKVVSDTAPFVVRFKGPTEGKTIVHDMVKGDIEFDNSVLDDIVLLRSDGTPTYNLAVVADDHDMGITHVIRGDDHVNNTPRQILIYQAMGWDVPTFGHIPLIFGEDGKKLSKRNGAAAVTDYKEMGFLTEALVNYLTRLGWGYEGESGSDIFAMEDAIKAFDGSRIQASPARMDMKKLRFINQHYINAANNERLAYLINPGVTNRDVEWTADRIGLLKGSAQTIPELRTAVAWVFDPAPISYDDKVSALLKDPENHDRLARLHRRICDFVLEAVGDEPTKLWNVDGVNALVHDFAMAEGVKMGKIGPMVRGALIGDSRPSADLGSMMVALSAYDSMSRLKAAIDFGTTTPYLGHDV